MLNKGCVLEVSDTIPTHKVPDLALQKTQHG
jgi:hypothetical protein